MTQRDLAEAMRVSQQTVGAWETGRAIPGSDTLGELADYFNVTTDYLLGRPEQKQKKTDKLTVEEALSHVMSYDGKKIHEDDIGPLTEIIKRMMK
uniref:helix-turn-helix domain-containing protein n=1 Tax=Ligilactobacillus agilis TaxID=1601 RepID=UPI003F6DAF29